MRSDGGLHRTGSLRTGGINSRIGCISRRKSASGLPKGEDGVYSCCVQDDEEPGENPGRSRHCDFVSGWAVRLVNLVVPGRDSPIIGSAGVKTLG